MVLGDIMKLQTNANGFLQLYTFPSGSKILICKTRETASVASETGRLQRVTKNKANVRIFGHVMT